MQFKGGSLFPHLQFCYKNCSHFLYLLPSLHTPHTTPAMYFMVQFLKGALYIFYNSLLLFSSLSLCLHMWQCATPVISGQGRSVSHVQEAAVETLMMLRVPVPVIQLLSPVMGVCPPPIVLVTVSHRVLKCVNTYTVGPNYTSPLPRPDLLDFLTF